MKIKNSFQVCKTNGQLAVVAIMTLFSGEAIEGRCQGQFLVFT